MTIRYLLLGEGDFTYSLDMCRYFHASLSSSSSSLLFQSSSSSQLHEQAACQHDDSFDKNANPPDNDGERRNSHDRATPSYEITCTGVDTPEELVAKYKDIDFVLQRIRQCRRPDRRLSTVLRHGINAVETAPSSSSSFSSSSPSPSPSPRYHHVIFHHPHLGTEDAARHSRFLHHFFHAAVHRWLVPARNDDKHHDHEHDDHRDDTDTRQRNKGLVYLTLVTGQCRRWKCLDAAKAQGLVLLRRGAFRPPPPISGGEEEGERKTWYRPRRHQSGKSFAKRRRLRREEDGEGDGEKENEGEGESESETLVFGRACEWDDSSILTGRDHVGFFPWELEARNNASSSCKPSHSCRYCDKSFDEARSLKNHLRCCHPNSEEVRAALSERERKRSKHNKKKKTQMQEAHSTNTQPLSETNTHHNHHHHHQNDDEVVDGPPWICNYCNQQRQTTLPPPEQSTGRTATTAGAHSENQCPTEHETSFPPPRVFPHKQALLDHQRAKHFGDHVDIKPDWCKRNNHNRNEHDSMTQSPSHGSCPICHLPFHSEQMKLHHELEFLPSSLPPPPSSSSENGSSSPSNTASSFHACSYCSKPFREVRAKRQHENFCSERPSLGGGEKMITSST